VILVVVLVSVKLINRYFVYSLIAVQALLYIVDYNGQITTVSKTKNVNQAALSMSNFINENYSKDKKLAVYFDAGAVPFETGLQTLDVAGLMSKNICEKEYGIRTEYKHIDKMHEKKGESVEAPGIIFEMRSNELFGYNPDLIMVNARDSIPTKIESTRIGMFKTSEYAKFFRDQYLGVLQLDYRFRTQYRFVKGFGNRDYFYLLFEHNRGLK
jgi:hypothetical protein